jgi:hypothetical protein
LLELNISKTTDYISIKELSQNSNTYLGQKITIKGMLNHRIGGYSLQDDEGYWVWIGNNEWGTDCIEGQREYNRNSQIYSATGIWTAPEQCEDKLGLSCFGFQYYFKLKCSSFID